ncbi:MAG: prepilin-type N-terminal cleavage/methylation domain-containing protein [Candidatus Pacebacteria bacterium]|nr:prepilin-type N-terminal cleavage/methylation domain-containing protein [Candidatus Paceibacterota bacterium]
MKKSGFTLIEVIIYIALFSVLLGAGFVTAYQLGYNSNQMNTKSTTLSEGDFVLRKLNWVFTGIDPDHYPQISGPDCNQTLSIIKTSPKESPVIIYLNTENNINYVEINIHNNGFIPLNTKNVDPICLNFKLQSNILTTEIILRDGEHKYPFIITKYLYQ